MADHTITTEQIKALASISDKTEVWLKHAFPTVFTTIMDRVKTVEDARDVFNDISQSRKDWDLHFNRIAAFGEASLVHIALCEGWVPDLNGSETIFNPTITVGDYDFELPFSFKTQELCYYFETQFADLLKTIITGKNE